MIILLGLLLHLTLAFHAPGANAQDLSISSTRFIVIDSESGEVFDEQLADQQVAIASLTKMFTTIEALERGDLDQKIITRESDLFGESATTMGFGPGETFTLRDLLYGMMLPSGNDAAHAVARALGYQAGDSDEEAVARFVGYMNERATNMGLSDTHFVNPSGWGVADHYSTARDIARFAMYANRYPFFIELISTSSYTTPDGNYTMNNTNKLLSYYDALIGGKTGYDDDAGYCLVEFASRNGSTMISVTLDGVAPDVWYEDNVQLLEYGFASKNERLASGQPITASTVSFRDPDAAVILAMAETGASLGQPESIDASTSGNAADTGARTSQVSQPTRDKSGEGRSWLIPMLALFFVGAAVAAIMWWLRTHRNETIPSEAENLIPTPEFPPPD